MDNINILKCITLRNSKRLLSLTFSIKQQIISDKRIQCIWTSYFLHRITKSLRYFQIRMEFLEHRNTRIHHKLTSKGIIPSRNMRLPANVGSVGNKRLAN
jgi:hypothetical protein